MYQWHVMARSTVRVCYSEPHKTTALDSLPQCFGEGLGMGLDWKTVCGLERNSKPKTKKQFLFWRNTAILAAAPYITAAAAATATNLEEIR